MHHFIRPLCRVGIRWLVCSVFIAVLTVVARAAVVTGSGDEIGSDILHPDGYIFDQVLLTGAAVTMSADPGQVVRATFIDLDDDIVIINFSGAGSLSIQLKNVTGPAAPVKYNQIVDYRKGHASLTIEDSDATTGITVYSVGRANSVNQALFRDDVTYDGVADLAAIRIVSIGPTSQFGELDAGNARFTGTSGMVGIVATGVSFSEPILLHDLDASSAGVPVLPLDATAEIFVKGGDLHQTNGAGIASNGFPRVTMMNGTNSHGVALPAQAPAGVFVMDALAATFTARSNGSYTVDAFGAPSPTFSLTNTAPSWLSINPTTGKISGTPPTDEGSPFSVDVRVVSGTGVVLEVPLTLTVEPAPIVAPEFVTQPAGADIWIGTDFMLSAFATGWPEPTYQWRKNGIDIAGATAANLNLTTFASSDAGHYSIVATNGGGSVESSPVFVGAMSSAKVTGAAEEVGRDIRHANGNRYDQVLLQGATALITSQDGDITRLSFADPSDDITQVEFFGAGTVSITLDNASPPAPPALYDQENVNYVKGLARIVVSGADETTHLSVFTIGRANAVNQSLFRDNVDYDGVADISSITIASTNGKFGALRTANVSYADAIGRVGVYAPNVEFTGPVFVGDISASDTARPVLLIGAASDVRITGGDLEQPNGRAVAVKGITALQFRNGSTSHGDILLAQANKGVLEQDGEDVTAQIVQPPTP